MCVIIFKINEKRAIRSLLGTVKKGKIMMSKTSFAANGADALSVFAGLAPAANGREVA